MKNKILLTIIIPVYNASKYLERCLKSIAYQLNDQSEVIIIDDGSTDNSKDVYNDYCTKYRQIKSFYEENKGVGAARNLGIKKSSGKYITFVDADDFVSSNYIEKIFETIKFNYDIIFCQYQSDDAKNNNIADIKIASPNNLLNNIEISQIIKSTFASIEPFLPYKYNFRSVWSKIIKMEIVKTNNIFFPENISYGEDMIFMLYIYSYIKSKKFIPDILYHNFFYHETSATNKYKPNMEEIIINQDKSILEWINKLQFEKYLPYYSLYRLNDIILFIKYDFFHHENKEKEQVKKERFRKIIKNHNYKKYYNTAKKYNLLHFEKPQKRLIIMLAINNCYLIVKQFAKIKYRK